MELLDKLTAEYEPASRACTLLMPGWPDQPQVVARQDGRDAITVEASKCHPDETWKLVALREGKLSIVPYLTSRPQERPQRTVYDAVVMVPPSMTATFRVVVARAEG